MNSRDRILQAVKANQPDVATLPDLQAFISPAPASLETFRKVAAGMGSHILEIKDESEIPALLKQYYSDANIQQVVATDPSLYDIAAPLNWQTGDGRQLQDADLAIVRAQVGVAENGALWLTEAELQVRVLPFISQHLAVVLDQSAIVPTMHHAYERIGGPQTGFGVFIAGPSKTADIEQSLVLGAHGAKSLTIFIKG
ncbi:lactate utilization protein B/C [Chitinophaga agrisoli]|uniref:Lactate utilization protein B/C n=1 Tax=Chitinophaga agrisoli TaxID=2607653 RepID=A0A5B2VK33_9BACT|nr:LUD domain-containing protein [Chitinophaga agrisoli]KAA2239204.1 lactate utilization protein B/C [Chitinophaga agrisoli]